MSSRKAKEEHNMFSNEEFKADTMSEDTQVDKYPLNEKMTIPNFDNRINKDSAWSQMKDTK